MESGGAFRVATVRPSVIPSVSEIAEEWGGAHQCPLGTASLNL